MHSFSRMPILRQFIILLSVLLMLCIMLSVSVYNTLHRSLEATAQAQARNLSDQFTSEIALSFARSQSIINALSMEENVELLLKDPYTENTPPIITDLSMKFTAYNALYSEISNIMLVSPKMSWSSYYDSRTMRAFDERLQSSFGLVCFGLEQSSLQTSAAPQNAFILFGQSVYALRGKGSWGERLGSIFISLDPARMTVTRPDAGDGSATLILLDGDGNFYSFNTSANKSTALLDRLPILSKAADDAVYDFLTPEYLIRVTPIAKTGLTLVSILDRSNLNKDALRTSARTIAAMFAFTMTLAVIMWITLRNMINPLDRLTNTIHRKLPQADPSTMGSEYALRRAQATLSPTREALYMEGCSEIRYLSRSFDDLLIEEAKLNLKLHEATVTLYETELSKQNAELEFLRSQINPHFLNNTLEIIKNLAVHRDVPEIAQVALAMGRLFYYNSNGSSFATLREEIAITKAYLDIQRVRFPGRFDVYFNIRVEFESLIVLKFLLQPIIENAVFHGIEPKLGLCEMYIGARVEEGCLIISVLDDGVGIKPAKLAELSDQMNNAQCVHIASAEETTLKASIGLLNVHRRVRLMYGPEFGVTITSQIGEGTKVEIRLPLQGETINGASADR